MRVAINSLEIQEEINFGFQVFILFFLSTHLTLQNIEVLSFTGN